MKVHEPPMAFISKEAKTVWARGLENNTDPYGDACYRYASEWATRMEGAMASGESLRDCADRISHEADDEGITGFMYGVAVGILSRCWKYGEELRQWHNLKTQLNDEGERANRTEGVLSPAILHIENKDG